MRFDDKEVAEGMLRLGMSAESKFLRQHLTQVLVETMSPGLSDGAVRHFEGRRSFAAELIGALGLNREGGSGDGTHGTESELVRRTDRRSAGAAEPAVRGAARRVPAAIEP